MNTKTETPPSVMEMMKTGFAQGFRRNRNSIRVLLFAGLLPLALFASGCSSRYLVVMTNGTQVTSKGKPKLANGYYRFEDVMGRQMVLPSLRVREITPASMADEDKGRVFTPQTQTVR